MEVKRTIKTDVESFEMGDVISFTLKDGENAQAKAVKKTDEGMLFITVDCLKDDYQMFKNPRGMGNVEIDYFNSDLRHALNSEILIPTMRLLISSGKRSRISLFRACLKSELK